MAFNHIAWNQKFLANPGYNDAVEYGVSIVSTEVRPFWRVIGVHKLTGEENHGQSNVFVEVLGENGQRLNPAWVGWTWEGRKPNEPARPLYLDKPPSEPAGNLNMGFNQTVTVWSLGSDPNASPGKSEKVTGLHTRHGGGSGSGNYNGHHSFYVVWQWAIAELSPEPPPVEGSWRDNLTELQKLIVDNPEAVASLIVKMRTRLDTQSKRKKSK